MVSHAELRIQLCSLDSSGAFCTHDLRGMGRKGVSGDKLLKEITIMASLCF